MATSGNIEVAKAFVTIVPSLEGSQGEITKELTGLTNEAATSAGNEAGQTFGNNLATGIKATAATIAAAVTVATAAAVGVGKAFIDAANSTAAYGDEVDKTSQKMGLSAQAYQEWDYVMKIAGTDMASMTTGVKTLTNKLADAANGSSETAAMFASLGVSMEDIQTLSQEELFAKTIAGLQSMEEGTERAALANDLFGKSGMNLAPLLNMTAEETQDLIDKANEYGMIMDDEAVKSSADYTDALTTLKGTLTGLKNSLMSQFLPPLTSVMEGLSAIFAGKDGGIAMVQEGLTGIIENIGLLTPQLFELASVIVSSLLEGFAASAPTLVESVLFFLVDALVTLTGLLPQLQPTIQMVIQSLLQTVFVCLPLIVSSLLDLITDLATWLGSGDVVKTLVDGVVSAVTMIVSKFSLILPILLPAVVQILAAVINTLTSPENIGMLLEAVLMLVGAVFMALVETVPVLIEYIINQLQNLAGIFLAFWDWIAPGIKAGWDWLVSNCKGAGDAIKNWLSGFIENIKNGISNWLNNLKQSFVSAFENIKSKVSEIGNKIKDFCGSVVTTLQELPTKAVELGKNLIQGLWNGINDKVDWVVQKIKGMGAKVTDAIKDIFGIASPSKVFAEIGDYLAQGLGLGFEDGMDDVTADMTADMNGLTGSMTAEVTAYGSPDSGLSGTSNTYNGGAITVNVYGAEGQDVNALANAVAYKLEEMTTRRSAVYG